MSHGASLGLLWNIPLLMAFGAIISPVLKIPSWHGAVFVPAFMLSLAFVLNKLWPEQTHPSQHAGRTRSDRAAVVFTIVYCLLSAAILGSYWAPLIGLRPISGALLLFGTTLALVIVVTLGIRRVARSSIAPPVRRSGGS